MTEGNILSAVAYGSAALCVGIGAIGAGIGEGMAAQEAVLGSGRQPRASSKVFRNMLIGQALSESAAIFALLIALLLLFNNASDTVKPDELWVYCAAYLGAALAMGMGALGGGVGGGFPAAAACEEIARNEQAAGPIGTTMLLGAAITQSPTVFALVLAILLIMVAPGAGGAVRAASLIGAGFAMGLSALGSGMGCGLPAEEACRGTSRNPKAGGALTLAMLLGQAITQNAAVFGLVVALLLLFTDSPGSDFVAVCARLSAGICMGFGGLGPGIGAGIAGAGGCKGITERESEAGVIQRVMLLGQAVSQSTCIYAMVISFILIFVV